MLNQFLVPPRQLVGFHGDEQLIDFFLDRLKHQEQSLGPYYNIMRVTQLNFQLKSTPESSLRSKQDKGIFKHSWIEKLNDRVPSVLVYVYNWTKPVSSDERWEDRCRIFLDEFSKVSKSCAFMKKQKIKVIVLLFIGKNQQMNPGTEQAIQTIKRESEVEGKRFFTIQDALDLSLKKIKSQILEDSKNFYQDMYERYKADNKKLNKNPSEKKLQLEVKKSLLSEFLSDIKRTVKHYDQAYKNVQALSDMLKQQIRSTVKDDNDLLYNNYDLILKYEEIRTIGDFVRFKQIIHTFNDITNQQGSGNELITLFEQHFNLFKNFLEGYQHRENIFEEFKWRSDITYQFITQFLNFKSKKPYMQRDYFYDVKFLNLIQASVLYSFSRDDMVQMDRAVINHDLRVELTEPLSMGRVNYLIYRDQNKQDHLEYMTDNKTIIVPVVLKERWLNEKSNRKQLMSQIQELLKIWDRNLFSGSERTKNLILYLRACLEGKQGDVLHLGRSVQLLRHTLLNFDMKSELKRLLKIYEGLLLDVKENLDYETIISINLEMVFLKSKFEPINKVEKIFNMAQHIPRDFELQHNLYKPSKWLTFQASVTKANFQPEEEIKINIRITAMKALGERFQKLQIAFLIVNEALPTNELIELDIADFVDESIVNFDKSFTLTLNANSYKGQFIQLEQATFSGYLQSKQKFSYQVSIDTGLYLRHLDRSLSSLRGIKVEDKKIEIKEEPDVDLSFAPNQNLIGLVEELGHYKIVLTISKLNSVTIGEVKVKLKSMDKDRGLAYLSENKPTDQLIFKEGGNNYTFELCTKEHSQSKKEYTFQIEYQMNQMIFMMGKDIPMRKQVTCEKSLQLIYDNPLIHQIQTKCLSSLYNSKYERSSQRFALSANSKNLIILKITSNQQIYIHKIDVLASTESKQAGINLVSSSNWNSPKVISPQSKQTINQIVLTGLPATVRQLCCFNVFWNRSIEDTQNLYQSKIQISEAEIYSSEIDVNIHTPTQVKFQELFDCVIEVSNKRDEQINLMIKFQDKAEGEKKRKPFFISGMVQQQLNLLPRQSHSIKYLLWPVETGRQSLPQLVIEQSKPNMNRFRVYDSQDTKSVMVEP